MSTCPYGIGNDMIHSVGGFPRYHPLLFDEIQSENFETSILNLAIAESGDYIIHADTL